MQAIENNWRFINSGPADGATNMATDEALARCYKSQQPLLRVYAWRPYTISIGYHQNEAEIDIDKCLKDDIGVVRRPTGGRAIFHAHEVTYSVIIPGENPIYKKKALEIYNLISAALVSGLNNLGATLVLQRKESMDREFNHYNRRFACFAASAKFEIQYQSKKLVGSAQRRFENALLQHGSIILGNQHIHLLNYMNSNGNGAFRQSLQQLQNKTSCLEAILDRQVSFEEVSECLKVGFERFFRARLLEIPLTPSELKTIAQLTPTYVQLRRNVR